MSTATAGQTGATEVGRRLITEPFLHLGPDRLYNPLTDRTVYAGEPEHEALVSLLSGRSVAEGIADPLRGALFDAGWLVDAESDPARRSYLKYVALETHTLCNQACYFCPVSVDPRETYFMPDPLFHAIVDQLRAFRPSLEAVFLMSYNEPTLDRRFLDQCVALHEAGLPAAVNTNASGLTPRIVDALVERRALRFLSVNLSTLDRQKYRQDRGQDQLPQVLRNLDYACGHPVADRMVMMVLGHGDEAHRREVEAVRRRFGGSGFEVESGELMDRAGYLQIGKAAADRDRPLCGCENVGSRPLQHLHVTPHGRCVLCCEDYREEYVVGDLNESSIPEVLASERFARFRRWAYGREEAPQGFICRSCIYARRP